MPASNIKPTRMELNRTKARLKTATRGHKLLKDKRDELMRQFLAIIKQNQELRQKVEKDLAAAVSAMSAASAVISPATLGPALLQPKQSVEVELELKNVMSVEVPVYEFRTKSEDPGQIFPYGYAMTSGELDDAVGLFSETLRDMLELARVEKTMQLLAQEIEKTRRRVNALEYVMIPDMQETIRYITMKLEENERGNITRLMKVKDTILQEAHGYE